MTLQARRRLFLSPTALFLAAIALSGSFAGGEALPEPYTQDVPGTDVAIEMAPIPGGTFAMGSPAAEPASKADEGPQVEVVIEPFYMGRHEVTWDVFHAFSGGYSEVGSRGRVEIPTARLADAVTYPTPMYELEMGPILERMGGRGRHPAVTVSHFAAKQFTKWLSKKTGRFYRLPTEAEWEYACRAGTTTAYHFGDDPGQLGEYGWFYDNSGLNGEPAYREVGQLKPNPWGLYDMHGNAAELVLDQYEAERYRTLADRGGAVAWPDALRWPDKMYPRIVRGGGFESEAADCRSATRFAVTAQQNNKDPCLPRSPWWLSNGVWIGFRIVSPVAEPSEAEKAMWWGEDSDALRKIVLNDRAERQVRELIESPQPAEDGVLQPRQPASPR